MKRISKKKPSADALVADVAKNIQTSMDKFRASPKYIKYETEFGTVIVPTSMSVKLSQS